VYRYYCFIIPRVVVGENVNSMGEEDLLISREVSVINLSDSETIAMVEDLYKMMLYRMRIFR